MGFFQSTTAHCEADALAHVQRDNPTADFITMIAEQKMEFGRLTMFRFEVELPPARKPVFDEYGFFADDTPMFFATPKPIEPVRAKSAAGWA